MTQSIEQLIWHWASVIPNKVAVRSGKKSATYYELCKRILGAKYHFVDELHCQVGDTVILAAGKQIEFVYAYFGAHIAGLKVVPIDAATNETRLAYIVKQTHANLLVGFDVVDKSIQSVPLKVFADVDSEFYVPTFSNLDKVADVLFTTGTTGEPKGVPLTFFNEVAAARNIKEYINNSCDDVELLALPISHSFGLGRVRCCLSIGATLILLGSFANVKKIFKTMEEYHVTGFTMVPASWRYLKKLTNDKLGEYADQLKYIEMGSAYFSKDEKQELANLLPHTRICMHYGLTEASRSAFMEFHEDEAHLDSVGKASPNTDIKIMNERGEEVCNEHEGEICVKGNHVTQGYLNLPTQSSFFGSYFRTGDWGYKTDEGYIYLKSRKKDLINVGGKKVSPVEVEEQILKIAGVEDCACVASPDDEGILGEVVKAFIVKKPDVSLSFDTIKEALASKLEAYKIPVKYEWISEIPKTQNGKKQRSLLK